MRPLGFPQITLGLPNSSPPNISLTSSVYKIVTYYTSEWSFTRRAPLGYSEIFSTPKPQKRCLQNKSPHRAVGNMTPEECFSGKKPKFGHFRISGSLTYSHVPSKKRTKLEPTAEKGIFVGYDETVKDFCIYLPSQRKLVVRRDVKFEEEQAFRKSRELEQGAQQVPTP